MPKFLTINFVDVEQALKNDDRVFDSFYREEKEWRVLSNIISLEKGEFEFALCRREAAVVVELIPFLVKTDPYDATFFCTSLIETVVNKFSCVERLHISLGFKRQPEIVEGKEILRVYLCISVVEGL